MLRETGFPAVPPTASAPLGSRPRGVRPLLATVALMAAVVCSAFPASAAPNPLPPDASEDDSSVDSQVKAAMDLISRAFRTGNAELLASVLPREGKVFLSLTSVGNEAGYYGRGQIYFIFQRIFSLQKTVHFAMKTHGAGKPDGAGQVYCIGVWSYSREDGRDGETMIHFVLSMRKDRSFLAQIREAQ